MCSVSELGQAFCFGILFSVFVGVIYLMSVSAYLFLYTETFSSTGHNWSFELLTIFFFKFHISMLCNCLPISATADVFCHIMHGFILLLHMFSLPLLKFFLTSFSTVGHLLTLVRLGQFAVPFVGVVSSVATVQPRAVMCVGGTTLTLHFTDIVRNRN